MQYFLILYFLSSGSENVKSIGICLNFINANRKIVCKVDLTNKVSTKSISNVLINKPLNPYTKLDVKAKIAPMIARFLEGGGNSVSTMSGTMMG